MYKLEDEELFECFHTLERLLLHVVDYASLLHFHMRNLGDPRLLCLLLWADSTVHV